MRADLLALSAEALAAEYNPGLVKRAARELATGQGPELTVETDQTVVGVFPDGTSTRLPPGNGLQNASCTCGARACRHRIAVVLRYAESHGDATTAPLPAAFADEALARYLGETLLAAARAACVRGVMVAVQRPAKSETTTVVRLPTCTVSFHSPTEISAARCDCAASGACAHLALAVWALRQAESSPPAGDSSGAGAGAGESEHAPPFELAGAVRSERVDTGLLADFDLLSGAILEGGAAYLEGRFALRFAQLRGRAEAARMTWIVDLLQDLESLLERYAARSARYDEAKLVHLLVELHARSRAARSTGELPPAFILGIGEAAETLLTRVRLIALGARVDADGSARRATIYLADPETGTVCVLRKQWTYTEDQTPESGPTLARRTVLPRLDLGTLARGNLVSQAVRRRANRELDLGTRAGQTTLLPGGASFATLPSPLLVRSVHELRSSLAAAPPECLRPRVLTDGIVVLPIAEVKSISYAAAEQTCQATVVDDAGEIIVVRVEHRPVAPHALEAFAAALLRGARFVTGHARWENNQLWLEPLGVATEDSFVVLDLAAPTPCGPLAAQPLARPQGLLGSALDAVSYVLAEVAHHGFSRLPRDYAARLQRTIKICEEAGLSELGARLQQLALALGSGDGAAHWLDAALRWELLRAG